VPRDRVAGARVDYALQRLDGKILVIRTLNLIGDPGEGEAKVRAIQQSIGRRPILAIGNSSGDREMLEYTRSNGHTSLCLTLRHDDAVREYAYDCTPDDWAPGLDDGETLTISMRDDFRRVFTAPERMPRASAQLVPKVETRAPAVGV
jgi:hypothetical protein